jgi:hypothetical protein
VNIVAPLLSQNAPQSPPSHLKTRTFINPKCPIAERYPLWSKQLEMQAKYDPGLVFEPSLFKRMKAKQGPR